MLIPVLGGLALLYLGTRGKKTETPPAPLGSPGSNSSFFTGPSGKTYAIGIGQPGPDTRRVHSVFNDRNQLLFTFVQDAAGGQKTLGPESPDASLDDEIEAAKEDFGFED